MKKYIFWENENRVFEIEYDLVWEIEHIDGEFIYSFAGEVIDFPLIEICEIIDEETMLKIINKFSLLDIIGV